MDCMGGSFPLLAVPLANVHIQVFLRLTGILIAMGTLVVSPFSHMRLEMLGRILTMNDKFRAYWALNSSRRCHIR